MRFLNGEIFYTLKEVQVLIESWRHHYNAIRPHSSLGYRPPAPEVVPWPASSALNSSPAGYPNHGFIDRVQLTSKLDDSVGADHC